MGPLGLHRKAKQELRNARDYYAEIDPDLARDFLDEYLNEPLENSTEPHIRFELWDTEPWPACGEDRPDDGSAFRHALPPRVGVAPGEGEEEEPRAPVARAPSGHPRGIAGERPAEVYCARAAQRRDGADDVHRLVGVDL